MTPEIPFQAVLQILVFAYLSSVLLLLSGSYICLVMIAAFEEAGSQ